MAISNVNRCVCCGATIPEGRQVCPCCEEEKTITNYDRIRGMSILAMAEFMAEQAMQREYEHLIEENSNITATRIAHLKNIFLRQYLRYLQSEVDTK